MIAAQVAAAHVEHRSGGVLPDPAEATPGDREDHRNGRGRGAGAELAGEEPHTRRDRDEAEDVDDDERLVDAARERLGDPGRKRVVEP